MYSQLSYSPPTILIVANLPTPTLPGLFSGAFISVCPAVVGQISPTSKLGARIGTFFGVVAFATLIGTPIGGAFTGGKGEGVEGYRRVAVFSVRGHVFWLWAGWVR